MEIKNLQFFDKDGYSLNFEWNSDYNYWEGSIYLPKVSVGIHSNTSIYVLEKVYEVVSVSDISNAYKNHYYIKDGGIYYGFYYDESENKYYYIKDNTRKNVTTSLVFYKENFYFPYSNIINDKIRFTWDPLNKFVDEFFMFNFDESYVLKDTSALEYVPNDGPECETLIINRFDEYDVPIGTENLSKPLPIHIAFVASERYDATTYNRTLIMSYKNKTIARIKFFAETVEEDERLKIWNSNLGYKITPDDTKIFYTSDIKECRPDYQLLNEKRKELMLEGSNIYPYIGSYKAIINAIKFFGYENLGIIEYWKNVNISDENFGKMFHTSRYSLTQKETLNVGARTITLPNADYKKMNRIALVYSINQPTGEVDEWELPIVKEKFTYTIEEALIKLFALRKKLNNEFMPGSSRIADIIGEGNYFGLQGITKLLASFSSKIFEKKLSLDFEVQPGKYINLTDDRYFNRYIIEKFGYDGTILDSDSDSDSDSKYLDLDTDIDYYDYTLLSNIYDNKILPLKNQKVNLTYDPANLTTEYEDLMPQLYLDYYNEVFVEHTRYEEETYEDTDDIDAPSSAKIVLINKTFEDATFDNCDISFNSDLTVWNNNKIQNLAKDKLTFENVDDYMKHHISESDIKWTISRSKDQYDEDLRLVGIEKNYYRTEDYKSDDFIITDVTTSSTGKIDTFEPKTLYGNKVFLTLPYTGYYDVTLEIDGQKKIKKKCIKVEPYDIEIKGFYYDARELPENLDYDIYQGDDMYNYILSKIKDLLGWAKTEKTSLDNNKSDNGLLDFSLPTYSALTNEIVNIGPYRNGNIYSQWYLLDNISYDISLLKPYIQYARYIRNGVDVKPYTWFLLTYNYGKIVGKINPKWTIRNEITGSEQSYEGRYFTCLLKEEGNYSITLTLKDTNENEYKIIRNIFVVNNTANYNIYQRFKEEYDDMVEQEKLAKLKEYNLS